MHLKFHIDSSIVLKGVKGSLEAEMTTWQCGVRGRVDEAQSRSDLKPRSPGVSRWLWRPLPRPSISQERSAPSAASSLAILVPDFRNTLSGFLKQVLGDWEVNVSVWFSFLISQIWF